jgi:hypothetical protein
VEYNRQHFEPELSASIACRASREQLPFRDINDSGQDGCDSFAL